MIQLLFVNLAVLAEMYTPEPGRAKNRRFPPRSKNVDLEPVLLGQCCSTQVAKLANNSWIKRPEYLLLVSGVKSGDRGLRKPVCGDIASVVIVV